MCSVLFYYLTFLFNVECRIQCVSLLCPCNALHMFALQTVEIPDKPPAVVRLPQHLDHRADGHGNFIILFRGVAPHGTIKDT